MLFVANAWRATTQWRGNVEWRFRRTGLGPPEITPVDASPRTRARADRANRILHDVFDELGTTTRDPRQVTLLTHTRVPSRLGHSLSQLAWDAAYLDALHPRRHLPPDVPPAAPLAASPLPTAHCRSTKPSTAYARH